MLTLLRVFTKLFLAFAPGLLMAQSSSMPIQAAGNHLVDRLEILYPGASRIHTDLRGYWRQDIAALALTLDSAVVGMDQQTQRDLQYLANDNNEWILDNCRLFRKAHRPLLTVFYTSPAYLFEVNTPHFKLRVNPMAHFQFGQQVQDAEGLFVNQRGLELRGSVDRKVFFYTNLVETQARFPAYVTDWVKEFKAVPGAGFFKNYTSSPFNIRNGYDFNVATAYIGYQASRHIGIQLGHGQHFIGNGYRSMLLSDFASPSFFLKISTKVWRLHYQNLFLELSPISKLQITGDSLLPKKFAAIHYLSYKVTNRFTVGLFEATVLNRSRQLELQYLNPVIFYRTVEGMIGSPDNVMLGINANYNLLKNIQLYGQFMLDEFTFREFFSQSGWWANKYSIQAGAKYINAFGLDHLDFQLEYNSVQPYTYSHNDPYNAYTQYNQPLAHPLGANFREAIGIVRYQPARRVFLTARAIHVATGDNTPDENWGKNLLISYNNRVQDYGNRIGQGVRANINLVGLDASWMFRHNMFLDLKYLYRHKNSADDSRDQMTKMWSVGIRINSWNQSLDF